MKVRNGFVSNSSSSSFILISNGLIDKSTDGKDIVDNVLYVGRIFIETNIYV